MKVLVCGGRDYKDYPEFKAEMSVLSDVQMIIHGGASGADDMGRYYAQENGIQEVVCPANWRVHGNKAGPMRNAAMLLLKPDLVIAFPGGSGTADMMRKAKHAGVAVKIIGQRLARIETLMDRDPALGSPEGEELARLANEQEKVERKQFPEFDSSTSHSALGGRE